MSPLPPIPQNGDAGRLEQLSSGLKRQNGTFGPVIQRQPAGRPATGQAQPQPQAPSGPNPEMEMSAREVAIAEWARQYWAQMAVRYPSAWTQLYQQQADSVANVIHTGYYNSTPNFED